MTQAGLWWGAGVSMATALAAGVAEWRRAKRRDLDRVGIMPWNAIQIFAIGIAIIATALALKA